jgi:hypothetical protein
MIRSSDGIKSMGKTGGKMEVFRTDQKRDKNER